VRFSYLPDDDIIDLLMRDNIEPDPVIISMLGGSYTLENTPEGLLVFNKFWEGDDLISLDDAGCKALRNELVYLAGCIIYMYKKGLSEFQGVKVIRLNADKVSNFVAVVEQTLNLYDAGVRPFLVAKFFERNARSVLRS